MKSGTLWVSVIHSPWGGKCGIVKYKIYVDFSKSEMCKIWETGRAICKTVRNREHSTKSGGFRASVNLYLKAMTRGVNG